MDFLAGHDPQFGAVGAPDSDEIFDPTAHCDNADFLETGYPRTLELANAGLDGLRRTTCGCVSRGEWTARADLLDDRGSDRRRTK